MRTSYDRDHTRVSLDRRIARIAAGQHGLITRAQATACGAASGEIRWRVRVGRWERIHPTVYRLAGTTRSWRQEALAACLHFGDGAAVSHRSAAVLRGLARLPLATIELTVARPRNRRAHGRITIHSTPEGVAEEDATTIDGIPVTNAVRTLFDLAAVEPEAVVERCLDEALRRRLVSLPFLERRLAVRGRRPGTPMLLRLVHARATVGVTASPLETRILELLRSAGLPIPMLQYEVREGNRFVARLDFAYPEERVAIEADGFRYHGDRRAFDHDRARGNDVLVTGWRILRVTSKHLEDDPEAVATWVRRALSR